jgi:hypothetical protein
MLSFRVIHTLVTLVFCFSSAASLPMSRAVARRLETSCGPGNDCVIRLLSGVSKRGHDVIQLKERVILQDFLVTGTRSNQSEHIRDTQTIAPNAGTPSTFTSFDSDPLKQFHSPENSNYLKFCKLEVGP